jgi:hypothetical protein
VPVVNQDEAPVDPFGDRDGWAINIMRKAFLKIRRVLHNTDLGTFNLWGPLSASRFYVSSSIALGFASSPLIQVGLRFDLRATVHPTGLYKQGPTP